jgi:hypothetical protein
MCHTDHDGRRTGRRLAVTEGRFALDGAKDKAIYYEVVFRREGRPPGKTNTPACRAPSRQWPRLRFRWGCRSVLSIT